MEKRRWSKEEVSVYRRTHEGFFYANKDDANIFVPREYSFGYTLNFGNPISWIVLVAIIATIYILTTL
ncbi:MAG: hypothetical protein CVU96_02255 [Firmicutes bacterium HGW-Firmicutes-20]|jgi:uncharacterized membrane protein|nr:MAG: hypothetical protein CVU96_02255 [Firmicutes bacterium HGW-Firmicutes-20]PKM69618.1 MAG: hypothetical protein CVU94_03025 [Firmicutes bacterium HGW-Firmicutes-19]